MSESSETPTDATGTPAVSTPGAGDSPTAAQEAVSDASAAPDSAPSWVPPAQDTGPATMVADRPEIAVGAAFAGGLVVALLLKRLAR